MPCVMNSAPPTSLVISPDWLKFCLQGREVFEDVVSIQCLCWCIIAIFFVCEHREVFLKKKPICARFSNFTNFLIEIVSCNENKKMLAGLHVEDSSQANHSYCSPESCNV